MKIPNAGVVLLSLLALFAVAPDGRALEGEGCVVDGGSTSAEGIQCSPPMTWRDITFRVTASCKNTCTGATWQVNSARLKIKEPSCGACPPKMTCRDCQYANGTQNIEFYSEVQTRTPFGSTCMERDRLRASVTCSCPGCGNPSPILISLSDPHYVLTDAANGVRFDLDADGVPEQTAWTAPGTDDGFLVLDRNLNGTIDDYMEVFGDHTPQLPSKEPNGWLALAVWDDSLNGGNENGVIDINDYIFTALQIWVDHNHNGFSEPEELSSLEEEGLEYLDLDYWRETRHDKYGNAFKFPSTVGNADGVIVAWDVFFVHD